MKHALLLAFVFLTLARAQDLEVKAGHTFPGIHSATLIDKRNGCCFPGNPDIYGLGIRIGYYSQALSVWIANFFVLSESKKLRSVNTLFMFALFVGLVWISHDASQTYAIEAFLLIQLLSATWYVSILNQSKFSSKHWKFSPLRMVIQDLTLLGILAYSIWFWWVGVDLMQRTPCGTYIFFLSKVSLYGWFRSGFKVLSIIAVCFNLILMIGHMAQLVQCHLASYTRNPEYFRNLRKHLGSKDCKEGPCQKLGPLIPAQETPMASTDHALTASKLIADTKRDEDLDASPNDPDQMTMPKCAGEGSQNLADQIAVTQEMADTTENNAHGTAVLLVPPTTGQSGSPKFVSSFPKSPSISTLPKPDSHGSGPLSASQGGKLGTGGYVPESPPRRLSSSLFPTSAPLNRSNINLPQPHQAVLPFTPPSSSDRPPSMDDNVTSDPEAPEYSTTLPSFEDILAADVYLDSIFKDFASTHSVWTYHVPYTPIKISMPSIPHFQKLNLKAHKHHFRLNILIPLFIHVYTLRTYPFPLYPTLLSLTVNSPHHIKISPSSLATTIVLRNTRLPNHTPAYHYLPSAFCTLIVCVGLVLAIELSLYWNCVTGTTNMGQVGQLVPLVVGMGGLAKVLWVWWKGGSKEEEGEGALEREIRACAEVYEGLKGRMVGGDDRV